MENDYKSSDWKVVVRSPLSEAFRADGGGLPGNTYLVGRPTGVSGCLGISFQDLQVRGRKYGYL